MTGLVVLAGVEALGFVLILMAIKRNERLLNAIREAQHEMALALALAAQGRYREAEAAARRWAGRMHALREEPAKSEAPEDQWQSRFAP